MATERGLGFGLTEAETAEVQHRVREGETHRAAAAAIGCCAKSVQRLLRRTGGLKPRGRPRALLRLSVAEREEMSRGLLAQEPTRAIAGRLGRAVSTISRDSAANGGVGRYRAWRADERALRLARRPKPAELAACARLRHEVQRRLAERWSPPPPAARAGPARLGGW